MWRLRVGCSVLGPKSSPQAVGGCSDHDSSHSPCGLLERCHLPQPHGLQLALGFLPSRHRLPSHEEDCCRSRCEGEPEVLGRHSGWSSCCSFPGLAPEIHNILRQRCSNFSWSAPLILQCSQNELIPWCARGSLQRSACSGQLTHESERLGTGPSLSQRIGPVGASST